MDVFVIPLKKLSRTPDSLLALLGTTVTSLTKQTVGDFKIVVACNHEDERRVRETVGESAEILPLQFLDREWHFTRYVGSVGNPTWEMCRVDKGCRVMMAVAHVRRYSPDFIIPVDFDDFVRHDYLEMLRKANPPGGWYLKRGYALLESTGTVHSLMNFNEVCGTSIAYRANLLDFAAPKIVWNQEQLVDRYGGQYISRVLGSHRFVKDFFHFNPVMESLACYRIHSENHSLMGRTDFEVFGRYPAAPEGVMEQFI